MYKGKINKYLAMFVLLISLLSMLPTVAFGAAATYNYKETHVYDGVIDDSKTVSDKRAAGASIDSAQKSMNGHVLNKINASAGEASVLLASVKGTMPAADVTVEYVYIKRTYAFNEKHIYEGEEDTEKSIVNRSVTFDSKINSKKYDKAGYTLYEIKCSRPEPVVNILAGTVTGNVPAGNVTITYNYLKSDTVSMYKETHVYEGKIDDSRTVQKPVKHGDSIESAQKTLNGHILSKINASAGEASVLLAGVKGVMPKENVTVEYIYIKRTYALNVKHLYDDVEDTDLSTVNQSIKFDSKIDVKKLDRAGYTLMEITCNRPEPVIDLAKGTVTGNVPASNITITFKYVSNDKLAKIKVTHVFDGKVDDKLTVEKTVLIGAEFSYDKILKPGFTFDKINASTGEINPVRALVKGKVPKEGVTIEFIHTKRLYSLSVNHIYDGVKDEAKSSVQALNYESPFSLKKEDKEGFKLTNIEIKPLDAKVVKPEDVAKVNLKAGTVFGNIPATAITVNFIYSK